LTAAAVAAMAASAVVPMPEPALTTLATPPTELTSHYV
jgi:hypothetical protein